jgi:CHAD domain-containing protein
MDESLKREGWPAAVVPRPFGTPATRYSTVYYDSPDLRLTRWGGRLCLRRPDQWGLTLPPGNVAAPALPLHVFPGTAAAIPRRAVELATAYFRSEAPAAVAEVHALGNGSTLGSLDALLAIGAGAALPELRTPAHTPNMRASELFIAALVPSVTSVIQADAAIRLGLDEGVHAARIAVRRMRSDLRTFEPILDAGWAGELRERLRWFADGLGAAREADVLLERLKRQAACLPDIDRRPKELVLDLLRGVRDAAYRQLATLLRDRRYVALLDALVAAAAAPRFAPAADEYARDVVTPLMDGVWRGLRRAVRARSRPASDRELHRIRVKAKRVRYAAEAMSPVAGSGAHRFAARIARLQKILGDQHDAVVSCRQLRAHIGGGDGAFVAGELTSLEQEAANAARRRWLLAWHDTQRAHRRFASAT